MPFDNNTYKPTPRPGGINDEIKSVALTVTPSANVFYELPPQLAGEGHLKYVTPYHLRNGYRHLQAKNVKTEMHAQDHENKLKRLPRATLENS